MNPNHTPASERLPLREERLELDTTRQRAGERRVDIVVREDAARVHVATVCETLDVHTTPVVPSRAIDPVELTPQRLVVRLSRERVEPTTRTEVYEEASLHRVGVPEVAHVAASLRHERLTVDGVER